jgi:23S rRNA A2030 N6-methylase RlmJ
VSVTSIAGNPGDVVKHPALIAALEFTLHHWKGKTFRYADTFAGLARRPLRSGGAWRRGIGAVRGGLLRTPSARDWWHQHVVPAMGTHSYEGSVLIANATIKKFTTPELRVWDTKRSKIRSLQSALGRAHGFVPHCRAARPDEADIVSSDFVFVDPYDVRVRPGRGDAPRWADLRQFIQRAPRRQSLMFWLPMKADTRTTPPRPHEDLETIRRDARGLGCRVIEVRWAGGGRPVMGCQILYRVRGLPWLSGADAIVRTVRDVVDSCGNEWSRHEVRPWR